MKKVLIASNVVLLSAAIFFGCSHNILPATPPKFSTCEHCKDFTKEKFEGIPAGLAYQMISNYKTSRWDTYTIAAKPSATDARSVWFSLDTLKRFIWNLEQEVCNNKCVDQKDLGLRFYYAEYPKEADWTALDSETGAIALAHKNLYEFLHTVVIAPTYYSEKSQLNVDFDPRFVNATTKEATCSPASMEEVFDKLQVTFDTAQGNTIPKVAIAGKPAFILVPNINSYNKNKGSLIPPPPPPKTSKMSGEGNGAGFIDLIEHQTFPY